MSPTKNDEPRPDRPQSGEARPGGALSVAEAWSRIEAGVPALGTQTVALSAAAGRVLREPLCADRDFPPFDRVTMDGYAVRAAEALPDVGLRVVGLAAAGVARASLPAGERLCVEAMTGAPLPEGADAVVPYEEVRREGDLIRLASETGPVRRGANVHARGGDSLAGTVLVRPGTRLTGREIAVAAACGAASVRVSALPRLTLLSTGDELVEVDAPAVAPWQLRRSNDLALAAALQAAGFPGARRRAVRDDAPALVEALTEALDCGGAVVVTGGVSQGRFDLLPEALGKAGVRTVFRGVLQRPGKPMAFGIGPSGQPVFALPGNPVAAFVCLHRYVLPALEAASGLPRPAEQPSAALAAPFVFWPAMTCFLPVALRVDPAAPERRVAAPRPVNTSGDFAGLTGTDGFVELPADRAEFPAGTTVPFYPWR